MKSPFSAKPRRLVFVAAATAAVLAIAGCATTSTGSSPTGAATGTKVALDSSGRPILDDAYSKQVAAAAGVTVDTTKYAKPGPYNIAAVVQGPTNGWGTTFDAVMKDAFDKSGKVKNLMYVPWNFQTDNQVKGVEDAIAAGVDAILLTSLSRAGLASAVEDADKAGIPVITCMAGVQSDKYTAEVSRDIPLMGFSSADALATQLGGKGNVVMLHGIAGADATEFWKSGAEAAFAQYPGIHIVSEQYADWSASKAIDVMRTVIAQNPNVDAVWVGGLEMGPSVIQAYEQAGIKIPLLGGTNPTNGFLRLAIDKKLDFNVAPFPPAAAKECVDTVLKVLSGQPVAKYTDVIDSLDGAAPYDQTQATKWYEPAFNDDFIGPKVVSDQVYLDAGFGKK